MEQARATTQRLETGGLRAVISTDDLDRDGRIVEQTGWELDNFKANPVVMWNHEYLDGAKAFPIGRAEVDVVDGKLVADVTFADTDEARTVESLYNGGFLSSFSVGWLPLEYADEKDGDNHYTRHTRQELLELSAVPIPSNPNARALVTAALKGLGIQHSSATVETSPPASPGSDSSEASPVAADAEGEGMIEGELTSSAPAAEQAVASPADTPSPSGNETNNPEGDLIAEVRELITRDQPETSTDEVDTPDEGNGEGSASPELVASGLTTRSKAERVAEATAFITDAIYRRLTGRLPD